jgi:hypothetical protein
MIQPAIRPRPGRPGSLRVPRFAKALALAICALLSMSTHVAVAAAVFAIGSGSVTGTIVIANPGIPYSGARPGPGCVQLTHSVAGATSTILFQTTDIPPVTIFRGDITINESGGTAPAWEDASGVYATNACESALPPNNLPTASGTVSTVCASTVAGQCPVSAPAVAGTNFSCQWPTNAGFYRRVGLQLTLALSSSGTCTVATRSAGGVSETTYLSVAATVSGPVADRNLLPGAAITQASMTAVPYTIVLQR